MGTDQNIDLAVGQSLECRFARRAAFAPGEQRHAHARGFCHRL